MSAFEAQIVADLHECMAWAESGPDGDYGAVLQIKRVHGGYVVSARRPGAHGEAGELVFQPGESEADGLANLAGLVIERRANEDAQRRAA